MPSCHLAAQHFVEHEVKRWAKVGKDNNIVVKDERAGRVRHAPRPSY